LPRSRSRVQLALRRTTRERKCCPSCFKQFPIMVSLVLPQRSVDPLFVAIRRPFASTCAFCRNFLQLRKCIWRWRRQRCVTFPPTIVTRLKGYCKAERSLARGFEQFRQERNTN